MEDEATAPSDHLSPWENPSAAPQVEDPVSSKRTLEDVMDDEDDDDDFDDIKVVKKPRVVDDIEHVHDGMHARQVDSHDGLNAVEGSEVDVAPPQDAASYQNGIAPAHDRVSESDQTTGQQYPTEAAFEAVTPDDDVPDTSTDVDQLTTVPDTTASEMDPFESVTSESDNHPENHDDQETHHELAARSSGRPVGDMFLHGVVDGTSPSAPSSISSVEAIDTWSTTASEGADGPPAIIDDAILANEQPAEAQYDAQRVDPTSSDHGTASPSNAAVIPKERRTGVVELHHSSAVADVAAAALDSQSTRDVNDRTVESAVTVLAVPHQQLQSGTAPQLPQAVAALGTQHEAHSGGTSTVHSTHTAVATSTSTSSVPPAAARPSRDAAPSNASTGSRWSTRPAQTAAPPDAPIAVLSDVIWTRLLDFQHTNHVHHADFFISQLRSPTLDRLATWPEFAQLAIVARFTRAATALQAAGNKDVLLLQTIQEYEGENPSVRHVARLSPAEVAAQEGHFAFGYAPPQPASGMVQNPPRRAYNVVAELQKHKEQFLLDEFGRVKTAAMATAVTTAPATIANAIATAQPVSAPPSFQQPSHGRHQAPPGQNYMGGPPARAGRSPPRRQQDRSRSRSRDRRPPPQHHHQPPDRYQERYHPQHGPGPHHQPPSHHHQQPQQYPPQQQQQQRYPPPQSQHHAAAAPYQSQHQGGPPPHQQQHQQQYPPSSHHQSSYQQRPPPYQQPPSSYQQRQEYGYQDREPHNPQASRQYPPPSHHQQHQPQHHQGPPPSQAGRPYGAPPSSSQNLVEDFRRSDIFHRLPPSIRDALLALYAKGQIRELLNDSVLSRLVKLPEHLAVRAVENLGNTDSSHVDNIHGFFVGIISRVYERDRGPPPAANMPPLGGDHRSEYSSGASDPRLRGGGGGDMMARGQHHGMNQQQQPGMWSQNPIHDQLIRSLSPQVQAQLQHMASTGVMSSVDEWGEKCYEILSQLSESLAIEVLKRFTMANLDTVRNRSGFLIGVVKRCRQEYGLPP